MILDFGELSISCCRCFARPWRIDLNLQLFARVCAYYKSIQIWRIELVTPISQQLLIQLTNGLLHLGGIISEQHLIP